MVEGWDQPLESSSPPLGQAVEELDLEEKIKNAQHARFKLICTDGVFSMDGTIAQLDAQENADKSVDQIDSVVDAAYEEEVIDSVQVEEEVAQEGAANLIEEEISPLPTFSNQ